MSMTIGGQHSITGERIPDPQPPFVQPALTAGEHIDAAERVLKRLHRYYGDFDQESSGCSSPEVYCLIAIAHGLLALARK